MDPLIKAGVALVTGAGSGMGRAISTKFAEHGCTKLFLVDINEKGLQETQELIEGASKSAKVILHLADVSAESAVEAMINSCVEAFGRIDFAMNNAGVGAGGVRTADTSVEMFDRVCKVNEKGVFLCEKYEVKQMLTQEPLSVLPPEFDDREVRGSIVNTASVSGTSALPTLSAYNSSKHAVVVMTRVDARQFAPHKIRINSVCPGFVPTPMMTSAGLTEEFLERTKIQSPMNRLTHPVEVAETVVFLSSSRASGITGVNLAVDAGATLFHVI